MLHDNRCRILFVVFVFVVSLLLMVLLGDELTRKGRAVEYGNIEQLERVTGIQLTVRPKRKE